jgi:acetyltransferase-like isoleucine patch superfamily enzyme
VKAVAWWLAFILAAAIVAPSAATCRLERAMSRRREGVFHFWTHVYTVWPGVPGLFVRRAFYHMTLEQCSRRFVIGFGSLFTHREAVVEDGVYIGPFALIGSARLGRGCSIGSRASLLSGTSLHDLGSDGRWTPFDAARLRQVAIGEDAFVGEGAIVMCNVGARSLVAAGAVVSADVPRGVVVAGNPARFVRRLDVPDDRRVEA